VNSMISSEALRLYEKLVRGERIPLERMRCDPGLAPPIRELLEHKLVKVVDAGSPDSGNLAPTPPIVALAQLAVRVKQTLLQQQLSLIDVQTRFRELQQFYEEKWPNRDTQTIQTFHDPDEVCAIVASSLSRAKKSVHVLMSPLVKGHPGILRETGRALRGHGESDLTCRITTDSTLLADQAMVDILTRLTCDGYDVRVASDVRMQAWVVDGEEALITHESQRGGLSLLMIKGSSITAGFRGVFGNLHRNGVPFSVERPQGGACLTPTQRRVLSMLTLGYRDSEIASMMKISERTVRRYVSDLLGQLGAATRFHAAFIAARRGLVD